MMVDFLAGIMPDPVGVPVDDGIVAKSLPDGSIEWASACRKVVEGSHSGKLTFRALGSADARQAADDFWGFTGGVSGPSGLQVSGNPAKFLTGHNLFGSADVMGLLQRTVEMAQPIIWPHLSACPRLHVGDTALTRIDLTHSWLMPRSSDVLPFLRAMEQYVPAGHRGRGMMKDVGTLYYGLAATGKRAKDWQLKIYAKGLEIGVHPLPQPLYTVPGLLDDVNRTIRVELTLRRPELKRLGLEFARDWTPERVEEIWTMYVAKLDFGDSEVRSDLTDLKSIPGLKSRHRHAIGSWKAGNDMKADAESSSSFYRLRKEIKALTGYDIALPQPKSNVVPLRRVIEAYPAPARPSWADAVDSALAG